MEASLKLPPNIAAPACRTGRDPLCCVAETLLESTGRSTAPARFAEATARRADVPQARACGQVKGGGLTLLCHSKRQQREIRLC